MRLWPFLLVFHWKFIGNSLCTCVCTFLHWSLFKLKATSSFGICNIQRPVQRQASHVLFRSTLVLFLVLTSESMIGRQDNHVLLRNIMEITQKQQHFTLFVRDRVWTWAADTNSNEKQTHYSEMICKPTSRPYRDGEGFFSSKDKLSLSNIFCVLATNVLCFLTASFLLLPSLENSYLPYPIRCLFFPPNLCLY